MKGLTRLQMFGLGAVLLCSGCSVATEVAASNNMSATINGLSFQATSVTKSRDAARLQITGQTANQIVSFAMNTPNAPGTFALLSGDFTNYATYSEGSAPNQSTYGTSAAGSGSVTFTTLTPTSATGTFTFTAGALSNALASGPKSVTNGTFNVIW